MRFKPNRMAAVLTAALMIFPCAVPVFAAEPTVTTDETAYVNLDYYGSVSSLSVVKAVNLNGNSAFTDYGGYSAVTNMTDRTEPLLGEDSVRWDFGGTVPGRRFYFECAPKETSSVEIPWGFDVSYELNGVPARAEELAGACGLVTVIVEASPNEQVDPYYQDNMILLAGMLVDTADVYSFRAPGAQLQTIGSNQAAFYIAAPGQHTTFHFDIGTDSFETPGVFMTMVPATLSQLDEAGDIREDKQNVKDAAKAIDNILDDILDIFDSLSGGLEQTQLGLEQLNRARQEIYNAKDQLHEEADYAIASLRGLRNALGKLGDELDQGQTNFQDFRGSFGDIADSMGGIGIQLAEIKKSLLRIKELLSQIKNASGSEREALVQELETELEALDALLQSAGGGAGAAALTEKAQDLMSQLGAMGAATIGKSGGSDAQKAIGLIIAEMLKELEILSETISQTVAEAGGILGEIDAAGKDLEALGGSINSILYRTYRTTGSTRALLNDAAKLSQTVLDLLHENAEYLNSGAQNTLEGLSGFLGQTIEGLGKNSDLRKNKDVIANIIEEQWDKLDGDFGLLDVDTGAEKVSFTSPKNPEPNSIQIILRTKEIEIPDEDENLSDLETTAANIGFGGRVKLVFQKIGSAMKSVFS